jgi:MerR family transcriptional regulator, copper efflux regulator
VEAPIACSLSGADLAARKAQAGSIARAALVERHPIEAGQRLRFAAGEGIEARLRDIVAAEAECCPFLSMQLDRDGDALRLDVTGPAEALPIIAELFA